MDVAPVDYLPWPDSGCDLAEARDRTAERTVLNRWCSRTDNTDDDETRRLEQG